MTAEQLYTIYQQHPQVQTDTRKLQPGDIFFALSGPNFNGNQFAQQALEAGASFAVVDEPVGDDPRIIVVDNVLKTLQDLARHHREQFSIPVVAITGSNGKTTTKELVHAVLSSHYITYTTQGNLNNHIGIPLTLLRVKKDAELVVIEMGANHLKEIESYCQYTLPTHGVITNCGKAHLEGFGSLEGVRKGKGELFDHLRENGGSAFICRDLAYLEEMSRDIKQVITYGSMDADVVGKATRETEFLQVQLENTETPAIIKTHLVGDYNLPNVLCAVAIGRHFNVPEDKIRNAIASYVPGNSRSQMVKQGTNHIILDAYNANPTSMKAAIENIAALPADKKVLIIGAMMEMGAESEQEHRSLIDLIKLYTWDHVVLVGKEFLQIPHPYLYFNNAEEAGKWFNEQHFNNTTILIKGSRSQQMEKVLS